MSVENKIKFAMRDVGKSRSDIAETLKISEAAVSNKFYRDSFSAEDLIKNERLKSMRPLNPAELKRLREEFVIENTYDPNAIEGNTLTLRETALIIKRILQ